MYDIRELLFGHRVEEAANLAQKVDLDNDESLSARLRVDGELRGEIASVFAVRISGQKSPLRFFVHAEL